MLTYVLVVLLLLFLSYFAKSNVNKFWNGGYTDLYILLTVKMILRCRKYQFSKIVYYSVKNIFELIRMML